MGGGKGEIRHFPSALPEERHGGETVEELASDLFHPDKCNRGRKSNTQRLGQRKPAHRGKTKRIHRKGKEGKKALGFGGTNY